MYIIKKLYNMTFLTYENLDRGIRIKYPEDWEVVEDEWLIDLAFTAPFESGGQFSNGTACEQSSAERYRGSVVLSVEDISNEPMTLDEFTEFSLIEIKKDDDLEEIPVQSPAKLAGHDAFKISCVFNKANFKIKFWQIWTIIENKLYSLSYSHVAQYFSKYLVIVEEMANSLNIIT